MSEHNRYIEDPPTAREFESLKRSKERLEARMDKRLERIETRLDAIPWLMFGLLITALGTGATLIVTILQ